MEDQTRSQAAIIIPKVIHYCWFGRGPLPELALKCLDSWKQHLPEYELVRWDEDSFDIDSNRFVKEAYENRKFAFVTDYVRLFALHTYGGIYMDTDVQVLKPLDRFLHHDAFSGFESPKTIPTGIMGAAPGSAMMKELLSYYDSRSFFKRDGTMDIQTNVKIITNHCLSRGFVPDNTYQEFSGFAIYPKNYFCPLDWNADRSIMENKPIPEEAYAIHHYAGSWLTDKDIRRSKSFVWKHFGRYIGLGASMTKRLVGPDNYKKLKKLGQRS